MKTFELKGTLRSNENLGKKAVKALRASGIVPCVLYGGKENVNFQVTAADVRKLIYTPDIHLVELSIDGKPYKAIVKELQFHPVSENLLHIDFLQIVADKPVTVEIPVQLEGHAEGVKAGGKLSLEARKLKVKALYSNLPDRVVVDVNSLGLGKKIQVADLHYDNLEIVNVKSQIVAQVKATRASAAAAQA